MGILGSWTTAISKENYIQNYQISSDLEINLHLKVVVLSMTYINVIVTK